eukprot:GFUD01015463.1.p1 GENE.GFUD01015463.1~~GFUD01015463.1.p1  ORF type:complete len:584 (+),score=109.85 GFUD01015463.1:144-1895(+)
MSKEGDFDDIIDDLGGLGSYQKRLLYFLLGPLFFIMPFPLLHQVFVLHTPKFDCVHPEEIRPETLGLNKTIWQELFVPKEFLPTYEMGPSVCNYYNYSQEMIEYIKDNYEGLLLDTNATAKIQGEAKLEACTTWDYDRSEFYDTAITENDWVCSKAHYTPDLFTLAVVGIILGTFVFSAVADFFGRKTSFYVGCATCIVFTICMIPVSHNFHMFAFFKVMAAFGMLPLFQSPLNILCEISNVSKRGYVICYACIAWSVGNIAFPLVGYLIASWKILKIVSVAPLAFLFFTWTLLPESPRWLVSKGRTKEATAILRKIAETNNVVPPADLTVRVEKLAESTKEQSMGYLSLFGSSVLALRTILMTIGFTASAFVYYQMVINVSNMAGNTFLNLFLLGLVEGPGNMLGTLLANKVGRRWTHSGLLFFNSVLFAAVMGLVQYQYTTTWGSAVISFLCMWLKMNISATFVVAYIQAMEVFPTCVRQSGIGFCTFISQIISIGGPYCIALGTTDLRYPYLVMFLICLAGTVATSFLPETVGAKLPETLEDANQFGRSDKYFSMKPPRAAAYQEPSEQKQIFKPKSDIY